MFNCWKELFKREKKMARENIALSEHFWLSELVKSSTATRLGIDNWPADNAIVESLKATCLHILEPVRNHFGIPFSPNSGYRCLELNRKLKSKDTSQHTKGQAVDFELPSVSNYDLAQWCRNNLEFDQLILEFYNSGDPYSGWVHCSYVSGFKNRKSVITINKTGVHKGLVK